MVRKESFLLYLKYYIEPAWDFEQEFLANFWGHSDPASVELLEFYVADGTSKIVVMDIDGRTITDSINTHEYLNWAEDIIAARPHV